MISDSDSKPLDFSLLIGEIESGSGGSIAAAIRKLREHEIAAYKSGIGGPTGEIVASFVSALDAQAKEKVIEIEKTCAHHYQGFSTAAKELLSIQDEASRLQNAIQDINTQLTVAVKSYSGSCSQLSDCKMTLAHIDQCIEALAVTIPILDQYSRVEQSISEGRFYHALRALEDLEHSQLANAQSYIFSEIVRKRIPKMRAEIKNASLAELTDFLERIRKHSVRLGLTAMRETAKAIGMNVELLLGSMINNDVDSSSKQSIQIERDFSQTQSEINAPEPRTGTLDKELEELSLIASDRLEENLGLNSWTERADLSQPVFHTEGMTDFGPVYRCLHVHTTLHERAEFERYYCAQRRKQCQLILSLSVNQQKSMRNYDEFLGAICGFFVVDDHLRHSLSSSSASYQTYLEELWTATVERLVEFARLNASGCQFPEDLIRLKDFVILLNRTMGGLGFTTTALSEMITWIQRSYQRLLTSQWRQKFEQIIKEDKFSPIVISSPEELPRLADLYPPCITAEFDALSYPRQLCFSWMVPRIYKTVREYIDLCNRFCAHVDLAVSELEDTINRATNALFTDCLNVVLNTSVREYERNLPQLLQLCTNLEELETACGHLDSYLEQLLPSSLPDNIGEIDTHLSVDDSSSIRESVPSLKTGANSPRSHLYGASLLKDIRALIETFIYGHLNSCVDEFIGMINYNQPNDRETTRSSVDSRSSGTTPVKLRPNEHIVDLINWLSATFRLFANIPPKVSQTACMTVCKRIHTALYDILVNQQSVELTDQCMLQMSTDLAHCELFARSQPVPGLNSNMLCLIFADLRQLLDLFQKDDWAVFLSKRNKQDGDPYDRVSPTVVVRLLERIKESERKRTGFLQTMWKGDRERKKQIDDVIRQLRETYGMPRR